MASTIGAHHRPDNTAVFYSTSCATRSISESLPCYVLNVSMHHRRDVDVADVVGGVDGPKSVGVHSSYFIQSDALPSLRQRSFRSLDHRVAFVAGEAEANEPFLEQPPRHLL